jgi:glucosyl-3-phosphoglycerate phosphatase
VATTVVLVRHGESVWNAEARLQGQGGSGLSALGHAQAQATAAYLQLRYPAVALAVRSDLERVIETAAPWAVGASVEMLVDKQWREIDVGTWSGLTWDEVAKHDPETLGLWRAGNDVRRGGGETFAELRERTWTALEQLREIDGTVIVFTHGGCIRLGTAAAIGLPVMGEHTLGPLANGSVTELVLDGTGTRLASYNRHDHLAGVTADVV